MKRGKRGFTLIELIIVIVIIGILAVIAIPAYFANIEKARKAEAYSTMAAIRSAEQAYFSANAGVYTVTFPITVTMDGDTVVNLAAPSSPNFTYALATVADPCISATKITGTTSYSMKTSSGQVYATATCS